MNAAYGYSCRPLFKMSNIFPLYSQYIFSLSVFIVKNTDAYESNSAMHSINTRQGFDLHPPTTKLKKSQRRVY
jgi:hypothetical protein